MDQGASQEPKVETTANIRAWAGRMSGDPKVARLRSLTPGSAEGTVQIPFPSVSRESYLKDIKGAGIVARAEDAPIKRIPLNKLTGIQRTVNIERLAHYIENPECPKGTRKPGSGLLADAPVIVRKNGKLFCHDGHHRLCAAYVRGEKDIRARLIDLDDD